MSESPLIPEKLRTAWEKVDQIFLPNNSWLTDYAKCQKISKKLSYFNPNHSDRYDHIDRVYKFLSRGVSLTQAAVDWENPAICGSSQTEAGKNRGSQWQLVIAYSGFEITTKGLMNQLKNQFLKPLTVQKMIHKCNLPPYQPLNPPDIKSSENLEKWLKREAAAIGNFLGLQNKDPERIQRWMVKSRPIDNWNDAFLLAKVFRNTTTHGFLVPTKVKDWQLKSSLAVLTENLAEILTAALEKLES